MRKYLIALQCLAAARLAAGEVPEQFLVWGHAGKEIQYRLLSNKDVEKMKGEGKSEAEIEATRKSYDVRCWPEVQLDSEKCATPFGSDDQQRGYVLFARHYAERVYYYTVPAAHERISSLSTFAAQGEYEPLTFSIHALKELKDVKLELSAPACEDAGALLPKENFDLRVVRCYEKPYCNPWWEAEQRDPATKLPRKVLIPLTLEKRPAFSIPAGQTRQFWITLKVPQSQPGGIYRGAVTLQIDGQSAALPLRIRVLPFPLLKLDKATNMFGASEEKNALVDYREHGFNVIHMGIALERVQNQAVRKAFDDFHKNKNQKVTVPLPSLDEIMKFNQPRFDQAAKSAKDAGLEVHSVYFGFWGWFIAGWTGQWFKYFPLSQALDDHYVAVVNQTLAYAKAQGFPRLVVVPGDEPGGHPETLPEIKHYLELIKQRCPGAKTAITIGGGLAMGIPEVDQLGPSLDVLVTNYIDTDVLKKARAPKRELWLYNAGSMTEDPKADRYAYGFYAWKIGAEGMLQWVYRWGNTYWMAYRAVSDNAAYVFESEDKKPVPTIHWEAMREAIDDQRYGATLTRLIALSNQSGDEKAKQAAQEATAVIKDILSEFRTAFMTRRFPESVWRKFYLGNLDAKALDTCRWRLAQQILKLQTVLGASARLDPQEKVFPLTPEETLYE